MEAPSASVQRYGLTEVSAPAPASSAQVDVVFVHGLNGDPKHTWTSKTNNVFWPKDLLPSFVSDQNVRVLVYGYDADIVSFARKDAGITKDKIHNHAERLIADLFANRRIRKASERPIIFVAHSLGGLVVKRALIYSTEISGVKTEHLRSVAVSTYGVFFLGTPHKGSNLGQWGSYLEWLCSAVVPKKVMDSQPYLVEALKTNGETLQNIDRQFSMLMDKYHLYFFHEAKPTDFKGTLRFIVEEESAAPTLPDVERASIQADHSTMCKFESENSPGFDLIVDGIQRYAEEAPTTVRQRWIAEKQERLNQKLRKAKELVPGAIDDFKLSENGFSDSPSSAASPSHSVIDLPDSSSPRQASATSSTDFLSTISRPTEPFFIVPPGFRTNPIFVGMQKELNLLDQYLFDDRREFGTTCVLVHGHPGAGKSHLTRQYMYENRQKFAGGIFWINAHLIGEVENDFWQIAQKVIAKFSPERMLAIQEPGSHYTDTVREWFESRQEWLIVFDGVAIEKLEDLEKLYRFIPQSANSNIIYISRSNRLEAMDSLLNPMALKVRPLRESEGRELLFKELHIDRPRPAQIRSATDLVNKIGGLPLAINAIAKRIADTHVPIEKYSMKSYSTDPVLGGTFRVVMDDLRKNRHTEALNLISIICFFGPHIPVEMLHLGLNALKSAKLEVESSECGEEPDLNVTLGILMRHTLIERNEPDDDCSLSGSRDSLVDPEPIDMLKMHTVIQRFCSDSLNASKRLPAWLNHACQLFVCSYYEADTRIRSRHEPARVSDYRQYSIHGDQLRQHTLNYESKRQPLLSIRVQLDSALTDIRERIGSMEPRSSQESVVQKEFQCSIFDRTSTSSSSSRFQIDDSSPTGSSHSLILPEDESSDPASRRESETSSEAVISDQSSRALIGIYDNSNTDAPFRSSNDLPISPPMQKNLSATSTIRLNEDKGSSYSGVGKPKPSPPLATLSTEPAVGSMFKHQPQSSTELNSSRSAVSSLANANRPKTQSLGKPRSFWSRKFSYHHPEPQTSEEEQERNHLVRSQAIRSQITYKMPSDPAQSGYVPPTSPSTHARGRSDQKFSGQSRLSSRSPIRSEVLLSKSLAAPMVSPFYDAQYWETLASARGQSVKTDVSPTVTLLPNSSSLQNPQASLQQQPIVFDSSLESQGSRPVVSIGPSVPYYRIQTPVSSQNLALASTSQISSAMVGQSAGLTTISNAADGNFNQITINQPYQLQSSTTEKVTPKPMLTSPRQSPRIESIKIYESNQVRNLDGASTFKSSDFASTNSSPTMPPRMFSSIHVDDARNTERNRHQNVSAMVSSSSNWAEAPQQALQRQVHSAPLVYSQFSPSVVTASPSLSTDTTTAGYSTSSVAQVPMSLVTQRAGLGISEFTESVPVTGVSIVPASDPRRRLRAREGRLTERDVNILVRQNSEVDHPLAPKDEMGATETNPAVLTLNGPDGQTVLASTDLRSWKPVERNVGTRSSAPYPEVSSIPPGATTLSVGDLLIDMDNNHKRRRSAPESPGWGGGGEGGGWLGKD